MMDLHDGSPFWPRRNGIIAVHPPLSAHVRCDVAVVGAGIAGCSTSASTAMLEYEIDELLIDLTDVLG